MTIERLADGYEPRFDLDAAIGHQGELFVADIVAGLQSGDIEVKTDARFRETGNLYVEYECLFKRGWGPSGVATSRASRWAFVLEGMQIAVIVPLDTLRRWVDDARATGRGLVECKRGSHPTRGVALNVGWMLNRDRRRAVGA